MNAARDPNDDDISPALLQLTNPVRHSQATPLLYCSAMPLPSLTIDQDIRFFIKDKTTHLQNHHYLNEQQQVLIVQSAIKAPARDVLLGYADIEMNILKKLFTILTKEFKNKEKYARNLHKLKQEDDEPINLFATRIRRYVKGIGLTD